MMAAAPPFRLQRPTAEVGLSLLLGIQGITLFVAIPLSEAWPAGRMLLDLCRIGYAAVCIALLSRHPLIRGALAALLVAVVTGPPLARRFGAELALSSARQHEAIAIAAFAFTASVTVLVARHVFAGGRVSAHRVRGAILLYLNVAALFAIAYSLIETIVPGAFVLTDPASATSRLIATEFSYFSLTTITTTGYGDIVPIYPLARTLANLEAVFGQLFPATLLARLVALHLAHDGAAGGATGDAEGAAGGGPPAR